MTTQVKDPVCGMMIDPETAKLTSEYKGHAYYFCSPRCKASFDREPAEYAQQA